MTPADSGAGPDTDDTPLNATDKEPSAVPADTEAPETVQAPSASDAEPVTESVIGETVDDDGVAEVDTAAEPADTEQADTKRRGISWSRVFAFGVLPALGLLFAAAAGYLKYEDSSARVSDIANSSSIAAQTVQVAKDSTVKLLSYKPDTVEQDLGSATNLLTGDFRDSYTQLTHDVVIPGAKEKQISAVATVPAAASVSVTNTKAVVLVFVNQTVIVGNDAPTATASSVRITLDKVGGHWLISKFDPV